MTHTTQHTHTHTQSPIDPWASESLLLWFCIRNLGVGGFSPKPTDGELSPSFGSQWGYGVIPRSGATILNSLPHCPLLFLSSEMPQSPPVLSPDEPPVWSAFPRLPSGNAVRTCVVSVCENRKQDKGKEKILPTWNKSLLCFLYYGYSDLKIRKAVGAIPAPCHFVGLLREDGRTESGNKKQSIKYEGLTSFQWKQ